MPRRRKETQEGATMTEQPTEEVFLKFEDTVDALMRAKAFAGRAAVLVNDPAKLEEAVSAYRKRLIRKASEGQERIDQWLANVQASAIGAPVPFPNAKDRTRVVGGDEDEQDEDEQDGDEYDDQENEHADGQE